MDNAYNPESVALKLRCLEIAATVAVSPDGLLIAAKELHAWIAPTGTDPTTGEPT